MKWSGGQYLNELVSLTILALMAVALVAGQAGATPSDSGDRAAAERLRAGDAIVDTRSIRIDIAVDFEGFVTLFDSDDGHGARIEIQTARRN